MADDPDLTALPEAARAFVEGADLLPSALAPADVERLVAALVARADAARLTRLAEARDKALAKPARRGLHLLKTRGQKLPPPEKREFRVERGPYADEGPSLASMIDGHGEQVVWLARVATRFAIDHTVDVYEAALSESRGLVGFRVGSSGRKEWRQHARRVVEGPLPVAELPSAHVRWLIEEAWQRTQAEGRPAPEGFAEARIDLGPVEPEATHPALALAPPLGLEEARPELGRLHELPEVVPWVPAREALDKLDVEVGQIATSQLIVDAAGRRAQLEAAIERVANEAFTVEERARLARRLRETALLLQARGKLHEARLATTAAALTEDATVAASDNPFVHRLYHKVIDPNRISDAMLQGASPMEEGT